MKSRSVKHWIKYILTISGCLAILAMVMISLALVYCDNDDYRKLAVWGVARLAGYRMVVEGPFAVELALQPSLTAERMRFESIAGGPAPQLTSIGRLRVKFALKSLLQGNLTVKQLQLADVVIENLNLGREKTADSRMEPILPALRLPVIESLSVQNINLTDSERRMRVHVNHLAIDDVQDSGPLIVVGDGTVNETGFKIDGQLGALSEIFNQQRPYPLDLTLQFADLSLSVAGSWAHYGGDDGLNLQITADVPDLTNLLELAGVDLPLTGELKLKALLTGSLAAPRVSDLKLSISDDPSLEILAEAEIPNLRDAADTDIVLSAVCRNEDLLQLIFPDDLKVVQEFTFKGVLKKMPQGYRLADVTVAIVNSQGVNLEGAGWLGLGDIAEAFALKEVDLDLHLTAAHTESIRPLLTQLIPEIGSVDARGRLTGPIERLAVEDLIVVRGGSGPVRVETRGRIGWIPLGEDEHVTDMDLNMTIQAEQSSILSTFYGVPIGEIGTVAVSGRVTGATDRFQIQDLEFHSRDSNGLETKLTGGIDYSERDNGEILGDVKLNLEITAPNLGAAEALLGADIVPTLGPVSAKGLVLGTTDILSIEDVAINAGHPDYVQVKWQGRIGQFPLGGDRPIAEVQTFGSLQATKFSNLAALIGIKTPDIGPVFASWRETDRNGTYGMDNVKLTAGDLKTLKLNATGSIASIIRLNEAYWDGVNLQLSFKAADTHHFFKLLGLNFPDLGALDGRMALTGGEQKLTAGNLRLTVRSSQDMEIEARGGVGDIGIGKDLPLGDIDLRLTARAPGLSALPLQGDWHLPDLGPLEATARVGGRESSVKVDITKLRAGPPQRPLVQMRATLENIGQPGPMKLAGEFKADSRPWLEKFIQHDITNAPHFAGTFDFMGDEKRVRIKRLQLSTAERGGLSVLADGLIQPGADTSEFDLHLLSETADPAQWGSLFDLTLPRLSPLTIDGRYTGLKQQRIFEGETRLGKTRFKTLVRHPADHRRLQLDVRLSAHEVHLDDIGFYPRDQKEKPAAVRSPTPPVKGPIFDDRPLPLEFLKSNDVKLNLQADRIIGQKVGIGPVNIDVAIKEGLLRITTSDMDYRRGKLSFDTTIDATGSEPLVSLKIVAEDMDVDNTLSYLHKSHVLEGQLNLALDLKSRGRSSKEIAANLTGEFGVAIENGRIQRGVEMIASDALDLLFTAPAKDTFTDLNCMAGRLDFEKGVGTIKILYLDTPGVRARGGGSIDLSSETVDIFINPESKRRFFSRSSPIRIQGQLNDPSVTKIPANEAAILAAQLAIPIIALPARALGTLWSLIKEDKDENSPCLTGALQQDK